MQITQLSQTIVALKDNPLALICVVALCSLAVTAYAIRAVIVAVKNHGDTP